MPRWICRSADDLVSAVVWISDPGALPPRASVAGCDRTPECRLDRPSTDRGLRLAADASVHRSRSRLRLWRYRPQRLRAMGIRDRPISPKSPWQNGCSERLIGSIRRDCLDHVVVFGKRHLRHLLNSYEKYYNEARTHLSLQKDAPIPRAVQTVGRTLAVPVLGADCTINISERKFPTGTPIPREANRRFRLSSITGVPCRRVLSARRPRVNWIGFSEATATVEMTATCTVNSSQ
jgi:Integrase core domain